MSIAMILILIGAFGILVVVGLYLLGGNITNKEEKDDFITRGKRKEENKIQKSTNVLDEEKTMEHIPDPKIETYITANKENEKNSNKTVVLGENKKIPAFLIIKKGINFGEKYDVSLDGDTTMGRKSSNYIVVNDQLVSEEHALIRVIDSKFMLYDLASTNGTFVNGKRVVEPIILEDSQVIKFGDTELVFHKLEQ